jgi:hypothetical protein
MSTSNAIPPSAYAPVVPAALHPNAPPFEQLDVTLYRHLALANTIRLNPSIHPDLTVEAIFISLKRELCDTLRLLHLDMTCHICGKGHRVCN